METAATEALSLIKMGIDNGPAIVNAVQQYSRKINANHWPVGISPSQAEPAATAAAWALGTLGSEWWFRTAENSSKLDHVVGKGKLGTAYAMTGSASAQVKRLLFCAVLVSSVGAQQRVDVTMGLRKALASGANKMRSTLIGKANETALLDMDLVYNNWTDALISDICRLACRVKAVGTPFVSHQVLGTGFNAWDAVLSAAGVDQPLAAHTGLLHFSKIIGILHEYGYACYFGPQAFIGTHPQPYQFINYDVLTEKTDELLLKLALELQFKDPIGSATESICIGSTGTSISLVAAAAVISLENEFGDIWIHCCKHQDVQEHAAAALAADLDKKISALDERFGHVLDALAEDLIVSQFTYDCWALRYGSRIDIETRKTMPLISCAVKTCTGMFCELEPYGEANSTGRSSNGLAWVCGSVRGDPANPHSFLTVIEVDSYGIFALRPSIVLHSLHGDLPEFSNSTAASCTNGAAPGVSFSVFEKNRTLYWRVLFKGFTVSLFSHTAVWPFNSGLTQCPRQSRNQEGFEKTVTEVNIQQCTPVNIFGLLDAVKADRASFTENPSTRYLLRAQGIPMIKAAAVACAAYMNVHNGCPRHGDKYTIYNRIQVIVDD
ncbi:unnamed protein product [Umbelopsis vinacea]